MKQLISAEAIDRAVMSGEYDEALGMLDHNVEVDGGNSNWWYLRGRVYWRLGNRGAAISDYEHAAQINPDSPAAHALQMARDVMDFYNPDLLNP